MTTNTNDMYIARTLMQHYKGTLTWIHVSPVLEDEGVREVKMVVKVKADDPLEVFRRLHTILEVSIGR